MEKSMSIEKNNVYQRVLFEEKDSVTVVTSKNSGS